MSGRRFFTLAVLLLLLCPWATAQAGVHIGFNIGLPIFAPCPHHCWGPRVYVAPAPVYVAPAPVYVQPAPAVVQVPVTPQAAPTAPPPAYVPQR